MLATISDWSTETFENGQVILIDKPTGWTSFDVVAKIRNVLKIKKIGHAGTLDPLATGLLILCTGRLTKKISEYQEQKKVYLANCTLGAITPSYDAETAISQTFPTAHISEEMLRDTVRQFVGTITQIPPMYSALKIKGKRLYKLARKGKSVALEPREVTIEAIEITAINLPNFAFEITCSKGTYIRSLARDIGEALGCGAYLSGLRRTHIGDFSVDRAYPLEHFLAMYRKNNPK